MKKTKTKLFKVKLNGIIAGRDGRGVWSISARKMCVRASSAIVVNNLTAYSLPILMFNLRAPNLSTNNIPIHFANDFLNEFASFACRAHTGGGQVWNVDPLSKTLCFNNSKLIFVLLLLSSAVLIQLLLLLLLLCYLNTVFTPSGCVFIGGVRV